MAEKLYGFSGSGLFGYSHLFGGSAGGQAEYVRVQFADVGPVKVPEGLGDEQVLLLSDIFPTGCMVAENCGIQRGDTVAVWGCGPVGQLAIKSAWLLGAERVIAIDRFPERLRLAESWGKGEVFSYEDLDVVEELKERTGGRGPDACIDAVGMEAHGTSIDALYDRAKQAIRLETDRPHVLRQAIQDLPQGRDGLDPGRERRVIDKVRFGAAFGKGLTLRMGQTHVHRYLRPLLGPLQPGAGLPARRQQRADAAEPGRGALRPAAGVATPRGVKG
jgi:threonine dehydrogenase-like Zn-dependent dehydrogenase